MFLCLQDIYNFNSLIHEYLLSILQYGGDQLQYIKEPAEVKTASIHASNLVFKLTICAAVAVAGAKSNAV